jgi:hypothetical protein
LTAHGGSRPGAGRPRKWGIDDVVRIGLACEERTSAALAATNKAALTERQLYDSELQWLWAEAQRIPISKRARWLKTYGDVHIGDVQLELDMLRKLSDATPLPNGSTKPPHGTRRRVLAEVAQLNSMSEKTVDNLWQQYVRFVQSLRDDETGGP